MHADHALYAECMLITAFLQTSRCTDYVNVSSLDELLLGAGKELPPVYAMKMDVEGFETLALRGALGLLEGGGGEGRRIPPCFVIAEYWRR
jgi:hypothetical protein